MVSDRLINLPFYRGLNRNLDTAIDFCENLSFDRMTDGRYEIDGEKVFLNLSETDLGTNPVWECHQKYMDLQIVLAGNETMDYTPFENVTDWSDFDSSKDRQLGRQCADFSTCQVSPGMFALFFPWDAHRPGIGEGKGRKAVFKIALKAASDPVPASALQHRGTPSLQSERLVLRPYRIEDAQAVYDSWTHDPRVTRFVSWSTHENPEATSLYLQSVIKNYQFPSYTHWLITLRDQPIGDISASLHKDEHLCAEIGYCLSYDHWGQGYMTEALEAVLQYLFEKVGYHRIRIRHDILNPASGRVMQKAGLQFEGTSLQALKKNDGTFADVCTYAALSEPWLKAHAHFKTNNITPADKGEPS